MPETSKRNRQRASGVGQTCQLDIELPGTFPIAHQRFTESKVTGRRLRHARPSTSGSRPTFAATQSLRNQLNHGDLRGTTPSQRMPTRQSARDMQQGRGLPE